MTETSETHAAIPSRDQAASPAGAQSLASSQVQTQDQIRGRVLVVKDRFQGYESKIPDQLRAMGFEAQWSDARPSNGFWTKVLIRLGVLQRVRRVSEANTDRIIADAKAMQADTILLISPESVRGAELARMRAALPQVRLVLYMWDSAANRTLEQSMIDTVDLAYSFDMDDCDTYDNLHHVPLPHPYQDFTPPAMCGDDPEFDFCFIGTARTRRLKVLARIERKLADTDKAAFFYLFAPSWMHYISFRLQALIYGYKGVLSRKNVPFETYLEMLSKSACIVDVEQSAQGGLTIRTMDAVFAGRPLATTNVNVDRHDFYDHFPVSVFSIDTVDITVPEARNSARAEEMFQKYQMANWLETILSGRAVTYRRAVSTPSAQKVAAPAAQAAPSLADVR